LPKIAGTEKVEATREVVRQHPSDDFRYTFLGDIAVHKRMCRGGQALKYFAFGQIRGLTEVSKESEWKRQTDRSCLLSNLDANGLAASLFLLLSCPMFEILELKD
jgi:hypothetical protein